MAEPSDLPVGTPAGWHPDPIDPTRQRYWDGNRWTNQTGGENPDYLRAIATEVTRIRGSVAIVALVAFIQLVLIALWLLGVITVAFEPEGF